MKWSGRRLRSHLEVYQEFGRVVLGAWLVFRYQYSVWFRVHLCLLRYYLIWTVEWTERDTPLTRYEQVK